MSIFILLSLLLIIKTIVLRLMNKYDRIHKKIGASMDYYLDIINIFINIVNFET